MLRWLVLVTTISRTVAKSLGPPTAQQRLPDAIIIGVKKCGTRALQEFLKLNPNIKAPGPEIHFFDKNYDKGDQWYRSQMPPTLPGQITIEKSPAYFVSKQVPERVHRLNVSMKLIVVVRNPITRAISDYTQAAIRRKRSLPESRSTLSPFEEMATCPEGSADCPFGVKPSWGAIRIGVYHRHLQNWLRYFPLSQFVFVDGENLIRNPSVEINKVEKFLGLEPVVQKSDFVMDSIKKFPCVRKSNSATLHCLGKTKGRTHPQVRSETLKRLQIFYKPENEKFFRIICQKFDWF